MMATARMGRTANIGLLLAANSAIQLFSENTSGGKRKSRQARRVDVLSFLVRAEEHVVMIAEHINLERVFRRVDNPVFGDLKPREQLHLPAAIARLRAAREDFHRKVGRNAVRVPILEQVTAFRLEIDDIGLRSFIFEQDLLNMHRNALMSKKG